MPNYEGAPEQRRPYVSILLPHETFKSMFPGEATYETFGLTEGEDNTTALWGDVTCMKCGVLTSEVWLQKGDSPSKGVCEECHAEEQPET